MLCDIYLFDETPPKRLAVEHGVEPNEYIKRSNITSSIVKTQTKIISAEDIIIEIEENGFSVWTIETKFEETVIAKPPK